MIKEKYTIKQDGFVGYWHPSDGHEGKALIVFPGYDESDDTEERARSVRLAKQIDHTHK